jgi:hypothetical protein
MRLVSRLLAILTLALLASSAWAFPAARPAATTRFHAAMPFNSAFSNRIHPSFMHHGATEAFSHHFAFNSNFSFQVRAGAGFRHGFSETVTRHVQVNNSTTFHLIPHAGHHGVPGMHHGVGTHFTEHASFHEKASATVSGVPVLPVHHVPTAHLGFTSQSFNSPAVSIAQQIRNVAGTGYYANLALQRGNYLSPYGYGAWRGYGSPASLLASGGGSGGGGGGSSGGGGGGYVPGPGMGGEGGIEPPMPAEQENGPAGPGAVRHLDWPLAFRLLPRTSEAQAWQQEVDTLLPVALSQTAAGQADPETVAEIARSLDSLSNLLRSRSANMPANTAAEGESFLRQVAASLKLPR